MRSTKYDKCPKCEVLFDTKRSLEVELSKSINLEVYPINPTYNCSIAGNSKLELFTYKCPRCGYSWEENINQDTENIPLKFNSINRVEVIDDNGRSYVNTNVITIKSSIQDRQQTLKIFINK